LSKNKLKKFEELETFERVFQPPFEDFFGKDYILKGKWNRTVFGNDQPLVLELGCGKGEYTVGLAKKFPGMNFIGVDIKGARIWRGAKISNEENIVNSAFLRTRIEFISSFFAKDEVSEIWLTFPDPQLKKRRNKKRLSGSVFLSKYQNFLKDGGIIHLKTDNRVLYDYTLTLAQFNSLEILLQTDDLYHSGLADDILDIRTFYEKQYLAEGLSIHYLKFRLSNEKVIDEIPGAEE
jgi:tRNA (guanine-N7-)-methyltransferase